MSKKEWFEEWFDSEYYHILYHNRDDDDAQLLIDNLFTFLNLKSGNSVIDIACGKGRHSIILNEKGLHVLGTDLSENSINFANQFKSETLSFLVNDMRNALPLKFDAIFNLFTSFGYFNCHSENLKMLQSINKMLNANGYFVIDFLNATKVKNNLVPFEAKQINTIDFQINRTLKDNCIVKTIQFENEGKKYEFEEKVQLINLADFENLCEKANLKITAAFGDYQLNVYDENLSDRLIIIGQSKR